MKVFNLPKHTISIQPYQFGHNISKQTLLWLKNLESFGMNVPKPILSINNRLIEKIQDGILEKIVRKKIKSQL